MKEVKSTEINILGTRYVINLNAPREVLTDCDGECSRYDKTISIVDIDEIFDGNGTSTGRQKRYIEGLRHEIIHAFFEESGLDNYSEDEELVQWLAIQFPKLAHIFDILNAEIELEDVLGVCDIIFD